MAKDFEMAAGGSPAAMLWDELVQISSTYAAAGFIVDLFCQYVGVDGLKDYPGQTPSEAEDVDEARSRAKEDLLHVLDDNDGRKFKEWLAEFRKGWSSGDLTEFNRQALIWAEACCD